MIDRLLSVLAAALLEALARAVIAGVLVWLRREQAREATAP